EIVHFYQSNSAHVVHTTHDRGVITCRQLSNDRRFPSISGRVAAVRDLPDLVARDDPANYRMRPVIIRANRSSSAIVQLHGRVVQWVGNPIVSELRTNGANNYSLWLSPLNNEAANYHVVAFLNEGARRDVCES